MPFVSGTVYSYQPNANFVGTDSFTFYATTGGHTSADGTVTINVTNAAPVASNPTLIVNEGSNLTIQPSDVATDADGDPLTITSVTTPTNGSLTANNDGSYTYTPTFGYTGTDSFTVNFTDGYSASVSGTVTLTIVPVVYFDSSQYTAKQSTTDTITVDLLTASTKVVTVQYATTNGTASAGTDYTAASGTVTIPIGQSSATFTVATLTNAQATNGEKFSINLSNPVGAGLGSVAQTNFTILAPGTDDPTAELNDLFDDMETQLEDVDGAVGGVYAILNDMVIQRTNGQWEAYNTDVGNLAIALVP